jgi:hypothetical protein
VRLVVDAFAMFEKPLRVTPLSVGDVPNTAAPVPVSSESEERSCAEVIDEAAVP